jgi:hypothetical protein
MDFTIERIKMLADRALSDNELLMEIAYLYNREVKSDSEQPIKKLASILNWDISTVAKCVSNAIEEQFLVRNREDKGTWKISVKALRALHLRGKQFV